MHKLKTSRIDRILDSRRKLYDDAVLHPNNSREEAAEGGCGVVGVTSSFPVAGRHFFPAAEQMHNRGNGKGGGIAAAGLNPAQMGVSAECVARCNDVCKWLIWMRIVWLKWKRNASSLSMMC